MGGNGGRGTWEGRKGRERGNPYTYKTASRKIIKNKRTVYLRLYIGVSITIVKLYKYV